MEQQRKPEAENSARRQEYTAGEERRQESPDLDDEAKIEDLEDEGRGWCGVRTYITGPQAIRSGRSGEFKSNYHIDLDPGCKSGHLDEVSWTLTDIPPNYVNYIHINQQDSKECVVAVESQVPSGTQFTLHAKPKAHGLGKGTNARVACEIKKSDSQIISVS